MNPLLHDAVQRKRQYLIEKLLRSGVYKKNNKHLYEWTLSDLEQECTYIEKDKVNVNAESQQPFSD